MNLYFIYYVHKVKEVHRRRKMLRSLWVTFGFRTWQIQIGRPGCSWSHLQEVLKLKRLKIFMEFQHVQVPEKFHEKKLECKESKGNQGIKTTNLTTFIIITPCHNNCQLCFLIAVLDDVHFIWFKRMDWMKITLFCGWYLTYHPRRPRVHLSNLSPLLTSS